MKRQYLAVPMALATLLSGCASIATGSLPKTPGEQASGYGYIPLDPLPIDGSLVAGSCKEYAADGKKVERLPLLKALPDLSIRFAVADFDANGNLSFGPSKVTMSGGVYRAVLDYINVDAAPVDFLIRMKVSTPGGIKVRAIEEGVQPPERIVAYEVESLPTTEVQARQNTFRSMVDFDQAMFEAREQEDKKLANGFTRVTIPVYIGVGLRLSADIRAAKSDISLTGLGVIGAAAEVGNVSGTLTVQTLGVNGKSIATALPLPNKLDQTTIENGILAIGSSRAILYTADGTSDAVTTSPRVVGLYSPIGSNPMLINAIYAELSKRRAPWAWPCGPVAKPAS